MKSFLFVFLTACSELVTVPKDQLAKLNGFNPAMTYQLQDENGKDIEFNRKSTLQLHLTDGRGFESRIQSLKVEQNKIDIQPNEGGPLSFDMAQISQAQVEAHKGPKPLAWVFIGVFLVTAISLSTAAVMLTR